MSQSIEVLKALADETRLSIVKKVATAGQPIASCELISSCASFLRLSQPAMSHHFTKLVEAGILREKKQGTQKFYRLNQPLLQRIGIDISKL